LLYINTFCSDQRIKDGVQTIENALELVKKLEPVEFDWNEVYLALGRGSVTEDKIHSIGFIAQEVQKYIPEVVKVNLATGYYQISYEKLNSILVEAIKEQQVFIEDINIQIGELENSIK